MDGAWTRTTEASNFVEVLSVGIEGRTVSWLVLILGGQGCQNEVMFLLWEKGVLNVYNL